MRATQALFVLSLTLGGCTTSGQKWVAETPRTPVRDDRPLTLSEEEYHTSTAPYRREVIRLGSTETVPATPGAPSAAATASGNITQVTNVYVGGPTVYGGYGYYGYGASPYGSYGSYGPARSSQSTTGSRSEDSRGSRGDQTVRPGADHPALPSYGPPMLTQTGPAPAFR